MNNYFTCTKCGKRTYQGEDTFLYCPKCGYEKQEDIIYCKDCIYSDAIKTKPNGVIGLCCDNFYRIRVHEDSFCSWAQRRED